MAFAGINFIAVDRGRRRRLAGQRRLVHEPRPHLPGGARQDAGTVQGRMQKPGAFLPFLYALIGNLVIAWMLAGVLGHLGPGAVTLKNGVITAAFMWFGFILTTMVVNFCFSGRDKRLLRSISAIG